MLRWRSTISFGEACALTLLRLGYLVTIWNSHSVLWLRQRVFAPAPVTEQGEE